MPTPQSFPKRGRAARYKSLTETVTYSISVHCLFLKEWCPQMSCNTFAHKSQFVFLLCLLLAPLTEEEGDTFFVIEHPRCPAAPGSRDYVGHCFASLASELELELSALDHEPV